MAKRLTDTTKWGNKAFRMLEDKYKVLYLYLLDTCDNAGVVRVDLELVGFTLRNEYTREDIIKALGDKLVFVSEDKIVIRNYIAFQNGDVCNSESRIAASIRSALNSHGLLKRYKAGDFGSVNDAVSLS